MKIFVTEELLDRLHACASSRDLYKNRVIELESISYADFCFAVGRFLRTKECCALRNTVLSKYKKNSVYISEASCVATIYSIYECLMTEMKDHRRVAKQILRWAKKECMKRDDLHELEALLGSRKRG